MVQRLGYYRGPYQLFFITNNSYIFHLDDKALPKQRAENSFNTKSIPSCNFQYSYCFTFGRLEWSKWNMFAPSKTNGTNWKWSGIVYLGESDILSDTFDTSICSRYSYCVHLLMPLIESHEILYKVHPLQIGLWIHFWTQFVYKSRQKNFKVFNWRFLTASNPQRS